MTNFIPIFPLEIVVFPGEQLNLHIFEPRYKQLISECVANKKPFGMPVVINKKLKEFGALIEVKEIFKTYENGEMDIKTEGVQIFRILELIKDIPDKLYSGAIVTYPQNSFDGNPSIMQMLLKKMRMLHEHLGVTKSFNKADEALHAYDIAHHCGLTLQQEYELLQLTDEKQRQQYLKRHFDAGSKTSSEKEMIEKIQMNGHFKELNSKFEL